MKLCFQLAAIVPQLLHSTDSFLVCGAQGINGNSSGDRKHLSPLAAAAYTAPFPETGILIVIAISFLSKPLFSEMIPVFPPRSACS